MAKSHKWTFKSRFRANAYGWKGSSLASKRLKEAVSEIKKVAESIQGRCDGFHALEIAEHISADKKIEVVRGPRHGQLREERPLARLATTTTRVPLFQGRYCTVQGEQCLVQEGDHAGTRFGSRTEQVARQTIKMDRRRSEVYLRESGVTSSGKMSGCRRAPAPSALTQRNSEVCAIVARFTFVSVPPCRADVSVIFWV